MANPDNLTPFVEGEERAAEAGAKGGKAKTGSKHLANLIRQIGSDIDWEKTNQKDKAALKERYGKNGWQAVVYVAFTQAISGDMKAMDWLARNGFGTKMDITTDDEPIGGITVHFVGVDDEQID